MSMVAIKPGDRPPTRTVSCGECEHWTGANGAQSSHVCQLLGGVWAPHFGCAYFRRRPELGPSAIGGAPVL